MSDTRSQATSSSQSASEAVATIVRFKHYQSRYRPHPGPVWKWMYDVTGLTTVLKGFDSLETATRRAKAYGATKIVRAWEATP